MKSPPVSTDDKMREKKNVRNIMIIENEKLSDGFVRIDKKKTRNFSSWASDQEGSNALFDCGNVNKRNFASSIGK